MAHPLVLPCGHPRTLAALPASSVVKLLASELKTAGLSCPDGGEEAFILGIDGPFEQKTGGVDAHPSRTHARTHALTHSLAHSLAYSTHSLHSTQLNSLNQPNSLTHSRTRSLSLSLSLSHSHSHTFSHSLTLPPSLPSFHALTH